MGNQAQGLLISQPGPFATQLTLEFPFVMCP